MRDLFRLIFVAVLSFAVVGIAMVYSRDGDLRTSAGNIAQGMGNALADVTQLVSGETVADAAPQYTIAVPRPNPASWVGLAGFPDQSEIAFPLPRGATYRSGALVLNFDTEVADGGDGLLTLSVNGTTRGQVVLDSGLRSHQVRIDLAPADLLGHSVVLHLAGRGTTTSGQICPTDAINSGAAVTLTVASTLELVTDEPVAESAVALTTGTGPFALALDGDNSQAAITIWAAQQLNRSGIATRIGTAGAGETEVHVTDSALSAAGTATVNQVVGQRAIAQLVAARSTPETLPTAWPVPVTQLGVDTTIKTFRSGRRWTIPYAVNDLPDGHLPQSLQVRLKTTPLPGSNEWVVRIGLNGNLLETRRLAGRSDSIAFDVALPAERTLPTNSLVIDLIDTTPGEGTCLQAMQVQAQLLPETTLLTDAPADAGWAKLVEDLAAAPSVGLSVAGTLSAGQAELASRMLGLVLPRNADMAFDGSGTARLVAVPRSALGGSTAQLVADGATLALLPATGPALQGAISVLPMPSAELGAALDRLQPDDVIIFISGL